MDKCNEEKSRLIKFEKYKNGTIAYPKVKVCGDFDLWNFDMGELSDVVFDAAMRKQKEKVEHLEGEVKKMAEAVEIYPPSKI